MPFSAELVNELNVLIKFSASSQEGIKVHNTASPDIIQATQSLFDKGMITRQDGGYLTDRGQETAKHAQTLHSMLSAEAAVTS